MFLPYVRLLEKPFFTSALDGTVTAAWADNFTCDRVSLSLSTLNTYEYKYVITLRWTHPSVLEKAKLEALHKKSIVLFQPLSSRRTEAGLIPVKGLVFGYNPAEQQICVHDLENHDTTIARTKEFVVEITGVDLLPYRTYANTDSLSLNVLQKHTTTLP